MFDFKRQGTSMIASVSGALVGDQSSSFQSGLLSRLDEDFETMILDCRDLEFIDSSSIGILSNIHRTLSAQGKKLVLTNVPPPVMRVLKIVRMDELFSIEASGENPEQSLQKG